ncbi:Metallo-dependent hydrolase [Rhizopogon vinicolor AM-OR11-026]|uniref:Metallo-dependent hydrolase n=1 Tax=Rhizopogon vinicolor AM-OR11-026 TaxID=1314800 RepID=A0A1B7NJP7_9AGAM|nr:Metallo-dependent hydrolase [Rhizopogon vinicolor AM-OR11-026]
MCSDHDISDTVSHRDTLPPPSVLRHVVDVHCHPTDSEIPVKIMDNLPITLCAMSTRQADQGLVRDLATAFPDKVVPCFGYHPWFTHWISLVPYESKEEHYRWIFKDADEHQEAFQKLLVHLPEPVTLQTVLEDVRQNLMAFPKAMLGEVGIDRASRVPYDFSSPKELTPFTIPFEHQLAILEAQFDLAAELGRNISMHSVKSQQATIELFDRMAEKHGERWMKINLDIHSCSLSPQTWLNIEKRHSNVFLSLSTAVNSRSPNHRALIAACSSHRILVESDFYQIDECVQRTWDMVLIVAEVKGWPVEAAWEGVIEDSQFGVVRRLEKNWREFVQGSHVGARKPSKQQ